VEQKSSEIPKIVVRQCMPPPSPHPWGASIVPSPYCLWVLVFLHAGPYMQLFLHAGPHMLVLSHAGVIICWCYHMPATLHAGVITCWCYHMLVLSHAGVITCSTLHATVLTCNCSYMQLFLHATVLTCSWSRCRGITTIGYAHSTIVCLNINRKP
jgi:hypothetical protein